MADESFRKHACQSVVLLKSKPSGLGSVCVALHTKLPTKHRLASSGPINSRQLWADDLERQDADNEHGRHGSGAFGGEAACRLMSREVMFVVLGEFVEALAHVGFFCVCDGCL